MGKNIKYGFRGFFLILLHSANPAPSKNKGRHMNNLRGNFGSLDKKLCKRTIRRSKTGGQLSLNFLREPEKVPI